MGLFGFGEKKSAEQKAYEKVYADFPSKKVGVTELEAALKAWETADGPQTEAWKAYFKIALAYDCGQRIPMDEAAAKQYHEKVRSIIGKNGDQRLKQWCIDFYYWYNQCSINFYKKLDAQTLNIRRLGNAVMNVMGISGDACMLKEIHSTMNDVWTSGTGTASETAQAFWYYTNACKVDRDGKLVNKNDPKYKDDLYAKDFEKRADKETKEQKKVTDHKKTYADMKTDYHNYIFGMQFINDSPICAICMYDFSTVEGVYRLALQKIMKDAYAGNSMAVHKLVLIANNSEEEHRYLESAFSSQYRTVDAFLYNSLESCRNAGDYTAVDLIAKYYTANAD